MADINEAPTWSLYIIECADGRFYTGISTDPARRLLEHRQGGAKAAKALRGKGPLKMVFSQPIGDRSAAQSAEYQLKQLKRLEKIKVIDSGCFMAAGSDHADP